MCARYALFRVIGLDIEFDIELPLELTSRYNIAPTQPVLGIVEFEGKRVANEFFWGLIPFWADDPSIASRLINARSETLQEKPAFRDAFKSRRCIIPADGFYEWRGENSGKTPHYIERTDGQHMAFAGLWESWKSDTGESRETCTIITTSANEAMEDLHDRMPVILEGQAIDHWLDPKIVNPLELASLLAPLDSDSIVIRPVNKAVGNPRNEGKSLLDPPPQDTLF